MTNEEFTPWKNEERYRKYKTCKHNKVGVHQYPCSVCKNHDKWEVEDDGTNSTL